MSSKETIEFTSSWILSSTFHIYNIIGVESFIGSLLLRKDLMNIMQSSMQHK